MHNSAETYLKQAFRLPRSGMVPYTGGPVEGLHSLIRSVDRAGNSLSFAVLRAKILYGQHLLRQKRGPKPKADDVLDGGNVGILLSDAAKSTCIQ